jgi:hypothetical protein
MRHTSLPLPKIAASQATLWRPRLSSTPPARPTGVPPVLPGSPPVGHGGGMLLSLGCHSVACDASISWVRSALCATWPRKRRCAVGAAGVLCRHHGRVTRAA